MRSELCCAPVLSCLSPHIDAAGDLTVIAYDGARRELARAWLDPEIKVGEVRYETLALDSRTPITSVWNWCSTFGPRPGLSLPTSTEGPASERDEAMLP
jgi:hypothetical protein